MSKTIATHKLFRLAVLLLCLFGVATSFVPRNPAARDVPTAHPTLHPLAFSSSSTTTTTALSYVTTNIEDPGFMPNLTPVLAAAVALGLLVAAQTFINQMLDGDQGLAAFLKDGSGYNKSGFQERGIKKTASSDKDPIPWLKLPQLDFVDVAGQEKQQPQRMKPIVIVEEAAVENATAEVLEEMEQLRLKLNRELQEENMEEAKRIRDQLESLMKEKGIQFTASEDGEGNAFQ